MGNDDLHDIVCVHDDYSLCTLPFRRRTWSWCTRRIHEIRGVCHSGPQEVDCEVVEVLVVAAYDLRLGSCRWSWLFDWIVGGFFRRKGARACATGNLVDAF